MRDHQIFYTLDAGAAKQYKDSRKPGMRFSVTKEVKSDGAGRPSTTLKVDGYWPGIGRPR